MHRQINYSINHLEISKSVIISISFFIILYIFNIIEIELYSICALISSIILLIDIFVILKQEKYLVNPFLYLDVFLFFTTVFAPIFHFYSGSWLVYITNIPEDWTPFANKLSGLYLFCILILFITRNILDAKLIPPKNYYMQIANHKKLKYIYILMFISFILQTYIYIDFGGILGYIRNYGEGNFSGYGALFIISELFPLLFILIFFIKSRHNFLYHKWTVIYLFLFLLFISCLYFGGLRGSRSNTLWTLLHAILLIHISIRKFRKKQIILIALLAFGFLYVGKIYKNTRGTIIFENNYSLEQDIRGSDILAGDLSRYSIQTYLIYLYERRTDYTLKLGSTYIGDLLKFTPIDQGIDKVMAGTELLVSKNAYIVGNKSSRVYGLLGESILNFGIILSPIVFILFAIIITNIKKFNESFSVNDLRLFLVPLFINFTIILFNSDLDNVFFFFIKRIIPMYIVIYLIKYRLHKKLIVI